MAIILYFDCFLKHHSNQKLSLLILSWFGTYSHDKMSKPQRINIPFGKGLWFGKIKQLILSTLPLWHWSIFFVQFQQKSLAFCCTVHHTTRLTYCNAQICGCRCFWWPNVAAFANISFWPCYFPLKFLTCEERRVGGLGLSKYLVGFAQGKQTAPVLKLNLESSILTFMKYFKNVAVKTDGE